jgi:succinate dehydrogenase / fumarate reductase membrane anchor subunit
MDYRSPLAKVRGLGSAKAGTSHWWMLRITSVALNAPYQETVEWLASPLNTLGIVAWLLAVFYHTALGLQVVIEDYVAAEGFKIVAVWTVNLSFLLLALAALIAVFRTLLIG